jgi:hypothetical protein
MIRKFLNMVAIHIPLYVYLTQLFRVLVPLMRKHADSWDAALFSIYYDKLVKFYQGFIIGAFNFAW